jgi:hypothetical protein
MAMMENDMKLKYVTEIHTNFESADFWLQRKGGDGTLGKPVKEFTKENIGVKVTRHEKVVPEFLFYLMEYVFNTGYWRKYAIGSTNLKNLRVEDVKNLELNDKQ